MGTIDAAAGNLRKVMRGKVSRPSDAGYAARRIWNGAVTHRPALVAHCETDDDVRAGELSRMAARHALPGGYPNVLGPGAHDQIPFARGSNIGRLRDVKGRLDFDNIFSGIPLAI
jgi:hypothetical protein